MILKIEFEDQVWVRIIDMLAERPYKESGPIITAMAQQIQKQREPAPKGPFVQPESTVIS